MINNNKYEETEYSCKITQSFDKVIHFSLTRYLTDASIYSILQN